MINQKFTPAWPGQCPTCPAQQPAEKRNKCGMCKEWVYYTPEHKGHKLLHPDSGNWQRSFISHRSIRAMGHMNVCGKNTPETFLETFYEKA